MKKLLLIFSVLFAVTAQAQSSNPGIRKLNGLSPTVQTFATGASGTNFAISSSGSTHTFNLPDASASNRGAVTTGSQTLAGAKTFSSALTASSTLNIGGNAVFTTGSTSNVIRNGTLDGTDNASIDIYAGSAASDTRGAWCSFGGNESANTGKIKLVAGNVAGGDITLTTGGASRIIVGETGPINLPSLTALRPLKLDGSKNIISSQIDLTSSNEVTGVLPIANGGGTSGSYTPTLFNDVNIAASTPFNCTYLRVGNAVNVSCIMNVDPTSANINTELGISLPVASNLAGNDCSGTCAATASSTERAAGIVADATNDRAKMQWVTGDTANHTMVCIFTYTVI